MNRVSWASTRRGGFLGTDLRGRVFLVARASEGRGWDVFWLHAPLPRTWVCRSVTAVSARAKLEAVIKREDARRVYADPA